MKKNASAPDGTSPESFHDSPRIHVPPGGIKLMEALKVLLQQKSFDSITTVEISKLAGANQALIYRYFTDKRGLLHKILAEYTLEHLIQIRNEVAQVRGALNKIRKLMEGTISFHKRNRVFSQVLLMEVRNNPGYFRSDAYDLVKQYARLIDEIVEEGIANKEIRDNISKDCVRDVIVGSIEHACLKAVVFDRDFDEGTLARNLTELVIGGLAFAGATPNPVDKGKAGKPSKPAVEKKREASGTQATRRARVS
jgi:TetR/AcrR family transcriptional regulator, fatty acid metabolism regulator protein